MPRLTHDTYCTQHRLVREAWLTDRPAPARLLPNEQWDLHDFFAPVYDFTDDELREYRQKITALDPSLPQRAGRALKKLEAARKGRAVAAQTRATAKPASDGPKRKAKAADRKISVKSLVHPEPNMDRLAKALLEMARDMAKADRAKKVSEPDSDQDSAAA